MYLMTILSLAQLVQQTTKLKAEGSDILDKDMDPESEGLGHYDRLMHELEQEDRQSFHELFDDSTPRYYGKWSRGFLRG